MEKENQEKSNPIFEKVNRETEILRGGLLLKSGEWEKALHIFFAEGCKDTLIEAALKFKNEGNEEAYNVALRHLERLEKRVDK